MIISMVPTDFVDLVWNDVKPHFERAVATLKRYFRVDEIREDAKTGKLMIWIVADGKRIEAAFTTRIIQYHDRRALAYDWIGGNRVEEWQDDVLPLIEKYAGEYGCAHIEGTGRKGWERVLRKHGWTPEFVTFRKELSHG